MLALAMTTMNVWQAGGENEDPLRRAEQAIRKT
jgi:hypothetical protein